MTRTEDNDAIIEWIDEKKPEAGTLEELNSFYLATTATLLCDISKSLAILADSFAMSRAVIESEMKKEGK